MNALEKLKLSKELRGLLGGMDGLKAMEKLKAAKRVRELVALLGGGANVSGPADQSSSNPLYQSVIDGAEITVTLLDQIIKEAEANGDADDPQLAQAVEVIEQWATERGWERAVLDSLFAAVFGGVQGAA